MRNIFKIIFVGFFVLYWHTANASPSRIISLKPNITEILFALGVGEKIVGVTKYCDYPEEVKKLPKVADYTRPFIEPIIALKPDIVIGSKEESSRKSVLELKKAGINVVWFAFTTLEETMLSIKEISKIVGRPNAGEAVVNDMQTQLATLKKKWSGSDKKKVLVVVGREPLVAVGKGTYLDELLSMIGAENIASHGAVKYPRIGLENVIVQNPDVIIDMSMGSESDDDQTITNEYWNRLSTVKAVRENKIYTLDIGMFRPAPKIVEGMEKLSRMIHL